MCLTGNCQCSHISVSQGFSQSYHLAEEFICAYYSGRNHRRNTHMHTRTHISIYLYVILQREILQIGYLMFSLLYIPFIFTRSYQDFRFVFSKSCVFWIIFTSKEAETTGKRDRFAFWHTLFSMPLTISVVAFYQNKNGKE